MIIPLDHPHVWFAEREAERLPVPYFHVVYTLPAQLRDLAYQNKRLLYGLLMRAAAETTLAIAANPRHLGARLGRTAVLHTWGSAMTHHPLAAAWHFGQCRLRQLL